jgi:hypothetical protein
MHIRELLETRLDEATNKTTWTFYHGTKSAPFDSFVPKAAAKGEQYWNPLGNGMYATDASQFASNFGPNVHKVVIPPGHTYKRITLKEWQMGAGRAIVLRALKAAFKKVGQNYREWQYGTKAPAPNIKKMSRAQKIDMIVSEYEKRNLDVRQKAEAATDAILDGTIKSIITQMPRQRDEKKAKAVQRFLYDVHTQLRQNSPYEGLYEVSHAVHEAFGEEIAEAFHETLPATSDAVFGKFDFVVFTETNDVIGVGKNGKSALEVVIFNPALQKAVKQ